MEENMGQGQMYSTTDFMRLVIKIFGILGMIFIGIAIAVPWASYTIPGYNYGLSLNGWGVSTNIPESLVGADAHKYLSDPFYINTMQAGIVEGTIAGICMILVFIFTIITLLISLKAFRNIKKDGINKTYLFAGIFTIVTIVLCVIGVTLASSYGNSQNAMQGGQAIAGGFGYTWGFILAIIAMIFFFIIYGLDFFLLQQRMGMQRTQPYQQPQMMYTSQQPPIQQQPRQRVSPPQQTPMEGSFCSKCGAQLQAGTKFCPVCGTKI